MKICVIGYSGSGKSTLTAKISEKYEIPALHLDSVQFLPNWVERPHEQSIEIIQKFLRYNNSWVIDGSYSNFLQEERFLQSDKIIFMNFSRVNCSYRAFKRFLKHRGTTRFDMTDGCNEKMDLEFVKWLLIDGRTKEKSRKFMKICEKYSEKVVILKNQKQLNLFIAKL